MLLEKQEDYKRIALWFDFFFFLKFILSIFFLINPKFKGLVFLIGVQFSLSLIIFLGWCLLLPQVFFSYQLIWIICVICPLLSFSFVSTPHTPNIMKLMPGYFLFFSFFLKK